MSTKQKRDFRRNAPERRDISTTPAYDARKAAKKRLIIKQSAEKQRRLKKQKVTDS